MAETEPMTPEEAGLLRDQFDEECWELLQTVAGELQEAKKVIFECMKVKKQVALFETLIINPTSRATWAMLEFWLGHQ